MNEKHLPIQYRIEIYVDSFINDPEVSFESKQPFLAISVGDEIDPSIWGTSGYGRSKIAKVIALRHLIFKIEGSHIGHSLSVCVSIQDKSK